MVTQSKLVHWQYVNRMVDVGTDPGRLACGNRPSVGGAPLATTHDMNQVTCGTCRRILRLPRAHVPNGSAILDGMIRKLGLDPGQTVSANGNMRELVNDGQKALGEFYSAKARGLIIVPEAEHVAELLFTFVSMARGLLDSTEQTED